MRDPGGRFHFKDVPKVATLAPLATYRQVKEVVSRSLSETHILSKIFQSLLYIKSSAVPLTPSSMQELITGHGSKTSTKSFLMAPNTATSQISALWLCQTILSMALCGLKESGRSKPVSHHQLCQISRSE